MIVLVDEPDWWFTLLRLERKVLESLIANPPDWRARELRGLYTQIKGDLKAFPCAMNAEGNIAS